MGDLRMVVRAPDLSGKRFGRLVIIKRNGIDNHRSSIWLCLCDCGNETNVPRHSLVRGLTISCGCYNREKDRKYINLSKINGKNRVEYTVWRNMIQRCYNKKLKKYSYYGGRDITVCDRWRYGENGKLGFDCFMEDMGSKSSPQHSIDRIDNDGNYEPSNCRWATAIEQRANQRPPTKNRRPYPKNRKSRTRKAA